MNRFLEIMREAVRARQAGVSAPVALMASCDDDDDWNVIFERLLGAARMEQSLVRMDRKRRRQ